MKVLQVIHGYPMRFNAGSEIYTQMLVQGLIDEGMDVEVFTREEDPFKPDYTLSVEQESYKNYLIPLNVVNVARQKDRYQSEGVDQQFKKVLEKFNPDIVHFQHLNHLSLGLVELAAEFGSLIFFTLHDYWLACPRGQFLQINYGEPEQHQLCDGQEDIKCATHCYSRYHTGINELNQIDLNYWTKWVQKRQEIIKSFIPLVDLFISPSRHLMNKMMKELPILKDQIIYLDYGFKLDRLQKRQRTDEDKIAFGYIGTHIVAKGIDHLIKAFSGLTGPATLRIWGRTRPETTPYLKKLISEFELPDFLKIEWRPEYNNEDIVELVFNHSDVIVVPSIWDENSPLVIHEALQCRVPVITANHGGMKEYIKHKKNGLLFEHRNIRSLQTQLQRILDEPGIISRLGRTGYLQSDDGNIPSMKEHVKQIIQYYQQLGMMINA